ncbi:hypothetical protein X777_03721, partial [Ooceraea biroi]
MRLTGDIYSNLLNDFDDLIEDIPLEKPTHPYQYLHLRTYTGCSVKLGSTLKVSESDRLKLARSDVAQRTIGPFELPPRVNGEIYRDCLEHNLPILLENVPLHIRRNMIYQHD